MDKYAPYKVIEYGGEGEIVEKKSRFIASVQAVSTEEEAVGFIEAQRKRFWDARHHCYAYILGEQGQTMRFSDDGEPSGTAGRPILEVLTGSGVRNLALVVTRYFGGTLLGTGGLVRAYTQAAQAGLAASRIATMRYGYELTVETDYNGIGKLQYLLGQRGIPIEDAVYTDRVTVVCRVPQEEKESLQKEITEATAGTARVQVSDPFYYRDEKQSAREDAAGG
ncbi:MAG: YigZ family protein [Bacteroidales bacterium]|nr:YigZ family protein [Bacteroidales bacterium]MCM1416968.1 YigZ family protein [bacterium]MCM1424514.1 YigZ family protein [bacterium]